MGLVRPTRRLANRAHALDPRTTSRAQLHAPAKFRRSARNMRRGGGQAASAEARRRATDAAATRRNAGTRRTRSFEVAPAPAIVLRERMHDARTTSRPGSALRRILGLGALVVAVVACADRPPATYCRDGVPPWLESARILVAGSAAANEDCRDDLCRHNENTDLRRWRDQIYLVHRTARSQILGPNSSLRVLRSSDDGVSFALAAVIPALDGRDIRDPIFYESAGDLWIKAITRIPGFTQRDAGVESESVALRSSNGTDWRTVGQIGPTRWGFWRVTEHAGTLYSAAYEDGDLRVVLYTSQDGATWSAGPTLYDVAADTPLETELVFTPSGWLLALVRLDGTDDELLGSRGRLRTKVCWSAPPYASFDCSREIDGERLDGPVHFWHDGRLFVIARRHLQPTERKRTALFELTGDLAGGDLAITHWGDFPSAGDTAYAGVVELATRGRFLVSYYSSDVALDPPWTTGFFGASDIWLATIDLSTLPAAPPGALCPVAEPLPPPDGGACESLPRDPSSICGEPCDEGNELGVGRYCTDPAQCRAPASVCSVLLNDISPYRSYVCTFQCDPAAGTDCGSDAACACVPLNAGGTICGCVPAVCAERLPG